MPHNDSGGKKAVTANWLNRTALRAERRGVQLDTRAATAPAAPADRLPRGRAIAVAVVSLGRRARRRGTWSPGSSGRRPRRSSRSATGCGTSRRIRSTEWAKETFGTADKLVLFIGVTVVILALTVARRAAVAHPAPGRASTIAAAQGVVGFVAVLTRPDLGQLGIAGARGQHGRRARRLHAGCTRKAWRGRPRTRCPAATARHRAPRLPPRERRRACSAPGAVGGVGQLIGNRVDVEQSRAAVGRLTPASPAPALPAERRLRPRRQRPLHHRQPRLLPHRHRAHAAPRLRGGLAAARSTAWSTGPSSSPSPTSATARLIERPVTLACVSNEVGGGLISNANFIGVPLRDLLARGRRANPAPTSCSPPASTASPPAPRSTRCSTRSAARCSRSA